MPLTNKTKNISVGSYLDCLYRCLCGALFSHAQIMLSNAKKKIRDLKISDILYEFDSVFIELRFLHSYHSTVTANS